MAENNKQVIEFVDVGVNDEEQASRRYTRRRPKACLICMKDNKLTLMTISGVVAGIVLGIILKSTVGDFSEREIYYINLPGDIFLRMLKGLILPLIVSSLVSAIADLDLSLSGKIAARAIVYYITTTVMAVILGIILVSTIRPGESHDGNGPEGGSGPGNVTTVDTLLDLVKNMFPPNVIQACLEQYKTVLKPFDSNPNETDIYKWHIGEETSKGTNILGLVVVSAAIGIALAQLGEEAETVTKFFRGLATVSMKITTWVIWLSPLGILFLVLSKILEIENLEELVGKLGLYFATVLVGILFHGFIVLSLIYFVITRKNPFKYLLNMSQAIATAFGTSSSSATLPVTIKCLEERNNIDPRVTRFCLPIGATINMDGTALYEAVAAIFIAQVRHIDLSIGQYIAISITATAASIGAAGIPQAGLVTMVMVLATVGLPAEEVGLILAVDWLLDRIRTAINVMGDAFGAGIVDHMSHKELRGLGQSRSSIGNSQSEITETTIATEIERGPQKN